MIISNMLIIYFIGPNVVRDFKRLFNSAVNIGKEVFTFIVIMVNLK